ncbi:NAD(P)H-dependent oxidoreductase [Aggregatibacter actinomycetemcomitans]|uniref:NAD(P)H-dependent oxidoreductase n=1 Tax=Aggregatibacter actinomycetemcomitans TaxID=714 RepID=UPI00197C0121|nr:NAD(P)H-dependent oxidoreductase [Aggregatibacter actinomycetemcomitans]MBN6064170.1 NAD(P)H-dependent oxidoreductase [Aggregatibacter actinomycetemcomitans]MBN6081247.1 NAD(P)H-dependent oxidoreductase [Aggregatibacter actinomycetemcomitans]MBN6084013.1 NAD(P)H-dependent oxidoreductase [Aggregatibacter actinomycetemcomitans]
MKHLIISAHPNQHSFNRAIVERIVKASHELGAETTVRDLYTLNFNPVLSWNELNAGPEGIVPAEIKFEQNLIKEADLITLVYPLWWMGFPAILKGYLDRVLSYGFAYQTENGGSVGLLGDKKMQHFITMGNNLERYQIIAFDKALQTCLVDGLFNFCGITDIHHEIFGDIHLLDEAGYQQILDNAAQKTQENLTVLLAKDGTK